MTKREMAYMIAGILAIGIFMGVALSCFVVIQAAQAEGDMQYLCWAMCRPGTDVLVRERPGRRAAVVGAVGCGDRMVTDWRESDGWLHVTGLANETGEGWVSCRYIVFAEPEMIGEEREIVGGGRVACRRWIEGRRDGWVRAGSYVQVYAMADGWAVTNKGYIQSRYIGGAE